MPPFALLNATVARRLALLGLAALAGVLACAGLGAAMAALARPAYAAPAAPAVPAAQNLPFPGPCGATLQLCLNNAAVGDTIVITAGTYVTHITLNKAVSLTGVSSATVVLQALGNQRVLTVTGAAISNTVVVSGLTFSGANLGGISCPPSCGGGVFITGTARPLLVNVTITNNRAWQGGGLYAHTGSHLVLAGSRVVSNTSAQFGGGVYAGGALTLSGGLIQSNYCTDLACRGGGLYANGALALTGTHFISNHVRLFGGGAFANSLATLNGGVFRGNQCINDDCLGGGLFANNLLTLTGTQFLSNTSILNGGGAFALGSATLTGAVFQGNRCLGNSCVGGGLLAQTALTMNGSSFVSNTSRSTGGGAVGGAEVTVHGGLFYNNQCLADNCWAGGLYAQDTLVLSGTQFISNTARLFGGGAFAANEATLRGGLFRGNRCSQGLCMAGGLYAGHNLDVRASEFRHNWAAGSGGGLAHLGGVGIVTNTLFAGNAAGISGSALFLNTASGHVDLLHLTIAAPAPVVTSAVYVNDGSAIVINSLFSNYGIGIQSGPGGATSHSHTLFAGVTTPTVGNVADLGGNITGTAGFVSPAAGNYHLTAASSAVDSAANFSVFTDFDGQPRPMGPRFDMGYDEFDLVNRLLLPIIVRN